MSRGQTGCGPRLLIAIILALGALITYYVGTEKFENPVTGRVQRVALSPKEEIALGLNSAPEMARQHGDSIPTSAIRTWSQASENDSFAQSRDQSESILFSVSPPRGSGNG